MEKYGVFDNNTGEYTFVSTKDEAVELFWNRVVEVARTHFHGTAYVTVIQNDDGAETWLNDSGEEITRQRTKQELEALVKKQPTIAVLP
jgi:hypothetical protein